MLIIYCFAIIGCIAAQTTEEKEESPLFSLKKKLVDYYENLPPTGSEVICAGIFFLHELTRLQEACEDKFPGAKEVLTKLDEEGGPGHCLTIPYSKFIDKYNWEGDEVSNYHVIITHTRWVWDELREHQLGKPPCF